MAIHSSNKRNKRNREVLIFHPICKHIAKDPQAQAQTKALSKSLQSQTKRKGNFKQRPIARQKTMKMTTTNRQTNHYRQGSTGGNSVLPQLAVTCKIEAKCSYQTFMQFDSEVLRNRQLRQHAKRYKPF